jgi:hypothetical protein
MASSSGGKVRVAAVADKAHLEGCGRAPIWKRRATREGDAPPMGVSFHQAVRRFEGRESATTGLSCVLRPCG